MPKTVNAAFKAKAWTFEANAKAKLVSRPRPGLEDYRYISGLIKGDV